MPEFADYANERWADGDWEEDEEDEFPPGKTCRHCGLEFLKWGWTDRGWRLHSMVDGNLHVCEVYRKRPAILKSKEDS